MRLKDLKENYDWIEAFNFADFGISEVKRIVASSEGYNDGESWLLVVELNDGSYGFVSAWCDYTGWDCQSGGFCEVKSSLEELQRWSMDKSARSRLNMILEDLDN